MLTQQSYFTNELNKLIDAEIERRKDNVITAHQAVGFDFSAYKHQVGIIEGLRLAMSLIEDAETIVKDHY
jgi:hypothetical protein